MCEIIINICLWSDFHEIFTKGAKEIGNVYHYFVKFLQIFGLGRPIFGPKTCLGKAPLKVTLANSVDLVEMPHLVAFQQGLHCLLRYIQSSGTGLVCCLKSQSTAMAMSRRSDNLTTFFPVHA